MSLDYFGLIKNVADIASKMKVLTGADARCGDFVYNLSNGTYSINQLAGLMRSLGDQGLTSAIDSVSPYVNSTTLSDIACAVETKTGMNPLLVGGIAVGGATGFYKGLQYAYRYFDAKTPFDLARAVLEKFGSKLANVDLTKVAKIINIVMNNKAEQMLNDLKEMSPDAFNAMSEEMKKSYKQAVVNKSLKTLEAKQDEVVTAITHTPAAAASTLKQTGNVETQEASLHSLGAGLADAISKILYNGPIAPSTSPAIKIRA